MGRSSSCHNNEHSGEADWSPAGLRSLALTLDTAEEIDLDLSGFGGDPVELEDRCHGAGLDIVGTEASSSPARPSSALRLRRSWTIPDTVGDAMTILVCGLNPSPAAADAGIGFARPGNRFWPAAIAAGLVTRDREPEHALDRHGLGMTDLVKRTTRRADELAPAEYRLGLERLERLATRHRPAAVCFVGLAGWRAAVDRRATAGPQGRRLGPSAVYLMPSTSGLNAHAQLVDLTAHLVAAGELAAEERR